jgi:Uma2 family endonuclease
MTLVGFPPVSDADLMRLGELNPGWSFERDDEGAIVLSPTSSQSGASSIEAAGQLLLWRSTAGGRVFDSSTGFRLSTGAVRCPDASWIDHDRGEAARAKPNDFVSGVPDIAVEIFSPSDVWPELTAKIEMYVREGCTYAIAIDPLSQRMFEAGMAPAGFTLDLEAIRNS